MGKEQKVEKGAEISSLVNILLLVFTKALSYADDRE
jgi:hypothetical protein